MAEPNHTVTRRIVVPLGGDTDPRTLDELARLAAALQAELAGLFIEDTTLLQASELPMTRLVGSLAGGPLFDPSTTRRLLRVWSERCQRTLSQAAQR